MKSFNIIFGLVFNGSKVEHVGSCVIESKDFSDAFDIVWGPFRDAVEFGTLDNFWVVNAEGIKINGCPDDLK